jgi:hypothetical protein
MDKHVLNDTERLRKIASTNRRLSSTLSALQSANRDLCSSVSQMESRLETQAFGRGDLKAELTSTPQNQTEIHLDYLRRFRPRWHQRYYREIHREMHGNRKVSVFVSGLREIPERFQDGPIEDTIPKRALSLSNR